MKFKKLTYVVMSSAVILLSGCAPSDLQTVLANGSAVSSIDVKLKATNPNKVKVYFGNSEVPKHYRVIGHVNADNYSMIATPHSQESITMELKKQAASIGGTGVINVSTAMDRTTGDVIVK